VGVIGESADAAGKVLSVVKDNPHGTQAIDFAAQSAEIVTHTVRNLLLPIVAINYGIDKAKQYFETRFGPELEAKLSSVAPEDVMEPKASIAGPAMQGLGYTYEEDDLRQMYLNLLRTSMNRATAAAAHPAFVEIIKQLSGRDARLYGLLAQSPVFTTFALSTMNSRTTGEASFTTIYANVVDTALHFPDERFVSFDEVSATVDNWVRLGLLSADRTTQLAQTERYSFEEMQPAIQVLREEVAMKGSVIEFNRGLLEMTDFGHAFSAAVIFERTETAAT